MLLLKLTKPGFNFERLAGCDRLIGVIDSLCYNALGYNGAVPYYGTRPKYAVRSNA